MIKQNSNYKTCVFLNKIYFIARLHYIGRSVSWSSSKVAYRMGPRLRFAIPLGLTSPCKRVKNFNWKCQKIQFGKVLFGVSFHNEVSPPQIFWGRWNPSCDEQSTSGDGRGRFQKQFPTCSSYLLLRTVEGLFLNFRRSNTSRN